LKIAELFVDCWQSAMLRILYETCFPLSKTAFVALFAVGRICVEHQTNMR
jgi:hypothetical protein